MKDLYDIKGINIVLTKNISRGTGLGSGASNAAAVLKSINEIYDLYYTRYMYIFIIFVFI